MYSLEKQQCTVFCGYVSTEFHDYLTTSIVLKMGAGLLVQNFELHSFRTKLKS